MVPSLGLKKLIHHIKYDDKGGFIDFGGGESEGAKLRHNLAWIPEQILNLQEEINCFNKEIRLCLQDSGCSYGIS